MAGDPVSRSNCHWPDALVPLQVAGVWRDYARQTGAIMIDLADYRRLTGDPLVNDAAIHLAPDAPIDQVAAALTALAGAGHAGNCPAG
jgi:putative ABC transport system permease protein